MNSYLIVLLLFFTQCFIGTKSSTLWRHKWTIHYIMQQNDLNTFRQNPTERNLYHCQEKVLFSSEIELNQNNEFIFFCVALQICIRNSLKRSRESKFTSYLFKKTNSTNLFLLVICSVDFRLCETKLNFTSWIFLTDCVCNYVE